MRKQLVEYLIKVKGDAKQAKASLGSLASEAKVAATGVGAVVAAFAAVGAGAVAMAEQLTGAVDRINTMADQSGLLASEVKALEAIAASTGKSIGDILPKDLAKRIADAARGTGEAKVAFEQLGVAVVNADGSLRSGSEVMRDTIDALGRVEDQTLKAALAQQAFGGEAQQMITAMSDTRTLDAWERFATVYGTDVGPAATQTTQQWQRATAMLSVAWDGMLSLMRPVVDLLVNMVDGFSAMIAMAKGAKDALAEGGWKSFVPGVNTLVALEGAREGFRKFRDEYVALRLATEGQGGDGEFVGPPPGTGGAAPTATAGRSRAPRPAAAETAAPVKVEIVAAASAADLTPTLSEDLPGAIAEGLEELEGVLQSAMIEAAHVNAESIRDSVGGAVGEFTGILGTIQDLAELPAGVMLTLDNLATSLETLPDVLVELPSAIVRAVTAQSELVPKLIEQLPTIMLESLKAAIVIGLEMTGIPPVLRTIAGLFDMLPGRFAESISDALKWVLKEINPFDGGFFGQTAEKARDMIPFFDTGGDVTRTGLAVLHDGERVLTPGERAALMGGRMGGAPRITIATPDPLHAARAVASAIGPHGARVRLGGT